MNRGIACLLFSLVSFLGCGGRTDTLGFDGSIGGADSGGAGGSDVTGGFANGGFGANGGTPYFAGAPSIAGAPNAGGAPSIAGAPNAGGVPGFGGFGGGPIFVAGAGGVGAFGGTQAGGSPNVAGVGGAGGIVDVCVAIADSQCNKCLCTACSSQVVSCFTDVGCAAILACVEKTNCQGFACLSACGSVIGQYGGVAGSALSNVFSLVTCSLGSQSVCSCN
jgi:hypothetical protein